MKESKCILCGNPANSLIEIEHEKICDSCAICSDWLLLLHIVKLKKEINSLKEEIRKLKEG